MFPGFTQKEKIAIIFLLCSFVAGLFLYWYRSNYSPLPDTAGIRFERKSGYRSDYVNKDAAVLKINLNTASITDLEKLPGIGRKTATSIVSFRNSRGDFKSVNEIIKVKGIGKKTFNKIKPYIVIK